MRAQTMTPQTGGFRGFGLKRMREGDGEGLPGTPLLQAGQASEAYRRTRQRSDKVLRPPEICSVGSTGAFWPPWH